MRSAYRYSLALALASGLVSSFSQANGQVAPAQPSTPPASSLSQSNDPNDEAALKNLTYLADKGDANSQVLLGHRYSFGQGVPSDLTIAASWYRRAAEQGNVVAQDKLGHFYDNGVGVPQDYSLAAEWYRKAAAQGSAGAQFSLGFKYSQGHGVPQDYTIAARWYQMAADQGYVYAQAVLGSLYDRGQGVPQDYTLAHKWLNLAASSGIASVASRRDEVARKMTPDQISEAQKLAREWKKK